MISSSLTAKRLVGRDNERAFFDARIAAAERREGSMILLFGEAGIGKTRLLRDWTSSATAHGFASASALNFEYAKAAYAPAADALRALVAREPRAIPKAPSARRLFDRFLSLFEWTDDDGRDEPWQKRRLFVILSEVVERVAELSPVLLAIDDAHWADPESLELLQYLCARLESSRTIVVLAIRSEANAGGALADSLAALERHPWCYRVVLGTLDEGHTRDLISSTLPRNRSLPQRAIDAICTRSEGNPLFAEDLVRDALARPEGSDALPASVEQSVRRRLEQLSNDDVASLEIAAAIGPTFDEPLFERVASLSPSGAARVLRTARDLGLIVDDTVGGASVVRFRHHLTRDAIYGRLVASERRSIHARIADAIERAGPIDAAAAAALSHHLARAGDAAGASHHAERAGDDAMRRYAFASARDHFEAAVEGEPPHTPRSATLHAKLGTAYELLGSARSAYGQFESAVAYHQRLGERQDVARLSLRLARAAFRSADTEAAVRHGRVALEASREDEPTWFMANVLLAAYVLYGGDESAARSHLEAAEAFQGARDPEYVVRLHAARAAHLIRAGQIDAWRTAKEACLREAERYGDPALTATLWTNFSGFARDQVLFDLADRGFRNAIEIADEYGLTYGAAYAGTAAAELAYTTGDVRRAHALIRAAINLGVEAEAARIFSAWVGIPIALALGDVALLDRLSDDELLTSAFATNRDATFGPLAGAHVELAARSGDSAKAREITKLALSRLGSADHVYGALVTFARHGDERDVETVAALVAASKNASPLASIYRAILEAAIATRRGDETAKSLALAAAEAASSAGAIALEGTALELADQPARALDTYRRAGFVHHVARLEQSLGKRVAARVLTPREHEVARLVARGDSNRAIADKLAISERTVEHHVASIFTKLSFHSRAELAAHIARGA